MMDASLANILLSPTSSVKSREQPRTDPAQNSVLHTPKDLSLRSKRRQLWPFMDRTTLSDQSSEHPDI